MADYPWLEATFAQLTHAFLAARGHHSILFQGEAGTGIGALTTRVAGWILTEFQREPSAQAHQRALWQAGNHPDFHLICSDEGKDIGIDQIRELSAKLQQFAQQDGNSVVVIRDASQLTEAAANALLKTLEEPPAGVYFLLQHERHTPLLPTILSRCQRWRVQASRAESLAWLAEMLPHLPAADRETALTLTHGRPLSAQALLQQDGLALRKTILRAFWRFSQNYHPMPLIQAIPKESVGQALDWLASFWADCAKARLGIENGWLNRDIESGILPFAARFSLEALLRGGLLCENARRTLDTVNAVNAELVLLDLCSRFVLEIFAES